MRLSRKIGIKTASVSTKFFSLKMNRIVLTESLLEMNYCYLWESCPKIVWYSEQPLTFKALKFQYTPDFELNTENFKILVEIKPLKEINKILQKLNFVQTNFLTKANEYYPKVILLTEYDLDKEAMKKLKRVYFTLLNKKTGLPERLPCPFEENYNSCPLKRNLNLC